MDGRRDESPPTGSPSGPLRSNLPTIAHALAQAGIDVDVDVATTTDSRRDQITWTWPLGSLWWSGRGSSRLRHDFYPGSGLEDEETSVFDSGAPVPPGTR